MKKSPRPIRSIALFAPNGSAYYVNVLLSMRKEFVKRGVDVFVAFHYFDPMQFGLLAESFKPDAIFEFDRTRDQAEGMPKDAVSIAWIADWRSVQPRGTGVTAHGFGGSDIYYFFAEPAYLGITPNKLPHWDYLQQGVDLDNYFPERQADQSDFSLIGYIPNRSALDRVNEPLKVDLLDDGTTTSGPEIGTVGDLIAAMERDGLRWNTYHALEARQYINQYTLRRLGVDNGFRNQIFSAFGRVAVAATNGMRCAIPDSQMYLIENQLLRIYGRKRPVDALLKVSTSMRLYGVGEWESYPELAPYFKGPLYRESQVRRVYASTKVNLHNAMTQMHARALDCMATAGTVMVNRMHGNTASTPGCLKQYFEPGVHYFEYDDDDVADVGRELLADGTRRQRVGEEARKAVIADHTWGHRVEKVLADLSNA